jgi:hypothetical protein
MVRVERLDGNPIIRPTMLSGTDGDNINGPSLIRAPDWLEGRLATYYLYFAHHHGTYIRLAYADKLVGPWTVYEPGTLRLEDTKRDFLGNPAWAKLRHLASPDIHVDHHAREIRMYFHGAVYTNEPPGGRSRYRQQTFVATSSDGLHFAVRPEPLGNPYFRVFMWHKAYYALAMPGVFYRSVDGLQRFVQGPTLFTPDMRHAAVKVDGHTLWVFYSVVGDSPERILLSTIDLSRPWMEWASSKPVVVLEPETDWEGVHHPVRPSIRGPARHVRQLRDPALFVEAGKSYLLYSVAGESGIAIADVHRS